MFRLATYLIIAGTSYIFLDIGVKGGADSFHHDSSIRQCPVLDPITRDALRLRLRGKKMSLGDSEFRHGRQSIRRRGRSDDGRLFGRRHLALHRRAPPCS